MASEIRDINLAPSGAMKIEWVKNHCDLLRTLEEEFSRTKPFEGKKVALIIEGTSGNTIPVDAKIFDGTNYYNTLSHYHR